MFRKVMVIMVLTGLAVVCFSSATWAVSIQAGDRWLLDMSTKYSGTTDSLGRTWNAVVSTPGSTTANLKTTTGATTGAAIWWAWDSTVTTGASELSASSLTDYPDFAFKDYYVLSPSTPKTCYLQGLSRNFNYEITIYGSYGIRPADHFMEVTINGITKTYSATGAQGEGLVTFTDVPPNGNNEIKIELRCSSTSTCAFFNVIDFKAVAVTEMPSFSPDATPLYAGQTTNVTIDCATPQARIYYTLNGEIPTESDELYQGPVTVAAGQILSARAWATGFSSPGPVKSAVYGLYRPLEAGDRLLLDIGNYIGRPKDGLGRTWNCDIKPLPGATVTDLVTTESVATDIDIAWGWNNAFVSNASDLMPTTSVLTDYPDFAIRDAYYNTPTTPGTCWLQNLNPGYVYNVTVYGSRGMGVDRIMEVTINGISQSYNAGGSLGEGAVTFTNLQPDGNNNIRIDFNCTASSGFINVIDVTVASKPEPESVIYRGDDSVVVDGDLSEWKASEFIPMNKISYGTSVIEEAAYAARWNGMSHQFYIAVKVKDPNLVLSDNYIDWESQDGIEVYVHTTGDQPYDYSQTQSSAQQYILGIKENRTGNPHNDVWYTLGGVRDVLGDENSFDAAGVVEIDGVSGEPTGWLFYELKVTAYEYLGLTIGNSIISPLAAGNIVGVDVTACDLNDNGFGMMAPNSLTNKYSDWRRISLHKLEESIPGDANYDKKVDVGDLGILAANYGGSEKNWSQGDFNNDGKVDVGDLGILAANYGTDASGADFDADFAKVFCADKADEEIQEETSNSICSGLGLPMIAGFILAGLMLVKVKD